MTTILCTVCGGIGDRHKKAAHDAVPSTNHRATRTVLRLAHDADDARLILDALGLLAPDGIAADDTRNYEAATSYDAVLFGKGDRK